MINSTFEEFIGELKSKYLGDLIEVTENTTKPFILPANPFFEKDVDKLEGKDDLSYFFSFDLNNFLSEVFFYISNECPKDCKFCDQLYKQTECCSKFNSEKSELDFHSLEHFIRQLFVLKSVDIHIIGGDIFKYSNIERLLELLTENPARSVFYSHYLNLPGIQSFRNVIAKTSKPEVVVFFDFPIIMHDAINVFMIMKELPFKTRSKFLISNEKDYKAVENFVQMHSIENYEIVTYFTGNNLDFFTKNIFLDKGDLQNLSLKMNDILANMTINRLTLGKLLVNPKGDVYSGFHFNPVGNIYHDKLYKLVYTEISKKNGWRKTRNNAPCSECIYQYLCPPISNVELAIGYNKICNVDK